MKTIKLALITLTIIFSFTSCEKDYPKDIPCWLKEKIQELKKENHECSGCCSDLCIDIHERSNGVTTTFWIMTGQQSTPYEIYDYYGNYLCFKDPFLTGDDCDSILYGPEFIGQKFVRMIWREK